MKTLFVSDLDGTLLTARETVSEYSLGHLNALIDECGLQFTYATARSRNSAAKACRGLRQNLPVILYNGAVIMRPDDKADGKVDDIAPRNERLEIFPESALLLLLLLFCHKNSFIDNLSDSP